MLYDEKPKRQPQEPCPVCGSHQFEWGRLQQTYYIPGDSMFRMTGYKMLSVRRCLNCDNVQLFVDETLTKRNKQMVWVVLLIVLLVTLFAVFLPLMMLAR